MLLYFLFGVHSLGKNQFDLILATHLLQSFLHLLQICDVLDAAYVVTAPVSDLRVVLPPLLDCHAIDILLLHFDLFG